MLNNLDACRGGFPCEISDLKEAAHCGVYHGPEGSLVPLISAALNIKPRTLNDQLNPNEPDAPSAGNLAAIAVMTTGHPVIARYFANLQAGFFYRVPKGPGFDKATAASVREFGEFLQAVANDGELLTPSKLRRIRKEGSDALAAIKASIEHVEQLAAAAGVTA